MAEVSFGEWLRRQRKAAGWTQAQLAQQINCSTSGLKKIEAEERRPSEQIVDRLAEIFQIPSTERTSFLRFARGNWDAAPGEAVKELPWRASPASAPSHVPVTQQLPSGTVTFLFTDIEGSTRLARQYPDEWESLRKRHQTILRNAIEAHYGYIFYVSGDAFGAAFHTVEDGVRAAGRAQLDIQAEHWEQTPLKVRMGIHTGKVQIQPDGQYLGYLTLSHIQRILSAGHGGQVLISAATRELLQDHLDDKISLLDLGEYRLKDFIRPEHIYQLVVPGLPVDFPPLRTISTSQNNLPGQLTSFIGRGKEIGELKDLIAGTRLITLTGMGGAGKTRLALQVAGEVQNDFEDGVWLVELVPLSDPNLVPQAIVSTLHLQEQAGRALFDVLKDYLSRKELLLIFDNCEHLIEACAQLADGLLRAAPGLKILATSREALGIFGESNYPVRSLSIPDLRETSPEVLSQSEAVRLFSDRAVSVQPSFEVTPQNALLVAQVCSRLDGIPLAIELAAARVKSLSLEEIAQRLDDRFHLLSSGSRTALKHHQTLRATLDWSYNLLSEEEKTLFARLSIFASGWSLEAGERVCAWNGSNLDVLDLLPRLVDKSLVNLDESRYDMLETTRQYARERLRESEDENVLHDGHLTYFLSLAEQAEPYLTSAKRQTWLERLRRDYDNLRSALAWSQESEAGLRLVGALRWFWEYAGMVQEGRSWAEKAIHLSDASDSAARAKALWAAGSMAWLQRDYPTAHLWLEESARIWQAILERTESKEQEREFKRGLARTLRKAGNVFYSEKKLEAARSLKQSSIHQFREVGTRWDLALDLHVLGLIHLEVEDFQSARSAFSESLSLFQQENDPWGTGVAFMDLGIMALRTNKWADAETWFKESLMAVQQSPSPWSISRLLALLGTVAAHKGESARAAELFGASEILREQMGFSQHTMHQNIIEEGIGLARQKMDDNDFARHWATGHAMTMEQAIAYALSE